MITWIYEEHVIMLLLDLLHQSNKDLVDVGANVRRRLVQVEATLVGLLFGTVEMYHSKPELRNFVTSKFTLSVNKLPTK